MGWSAAGGKSAWRCTMRHCPCSRRYTWVARKVDFPAIVLIADGVGQVAAGARGDHLEVVFG
jgi:hypothetical protein